MRVLEGARNVDGYDNMSRQQLKTYLQPLLQLHTPTLKPKPPLRAKPAYLNFPQDIENVHLRLPRDLKKVYLYLYLQKLNTSVSLSINVDEFEKMKWADH